MYVVDQEAYSLAGSMLRLTKAVVGLKDGSQVLFLQSALIAGVVRDSLRSGS